MKPVFRPGRRPGPPPYNNYAGGQKKKIKGLWQFSLMLLPPTHNTPAPPTHRTSTQPTPPAAPPFLPHVLKYHEAAQNSLLYTPKDPLSGLLPASKHPV